MPIIKKIIRNGYYHLGINALYLFLTNASYGTNHTIGEFDSYYQDVQQRIKDQKCTNEDYPRENKIDLVIVVDMLPTLWREVVFGEF